MTPSEIHQRLKDKFGDQILEFEGEIVEPTVKVAGPAIARVCLFLRDDPDLKMDSLMCLSGVDDPSGDLVVAYHVYSMAHRHRIALKVFLPRENPVASTVEEVWKVANWHEREAYDMVGIVFEGHSDLRRILCPDDWEGFPLRKDYKVQEYYRGMKVEV
jgi:NADH-quinone oxidoreductase subunit C